MSSPGSGRGRAGRGAPASDADLPNGYKRALGGAANLREVAACTTRRSSRWLNATGGTAALLRLGAAAR